MTQRTKRERILDRTRPPKAGPAGKVSFPRYFERRLRNGFKVFVVENHSLPIVTVGFVVKSGSAMDGDLPGLASVTSELLTKGTARRSAVQIAEDIDFVGGSLSSTASWDGSQIFVSVLKAHLGKGFDILQDIILNPSFPPEEIERLRVQRIASILQMKAEPSYLADITFSAIVFKNHPYGKPAGGTEESVSAMKRDDFVTFHRNYYTPGNSFIVFAGDINAAEAGKLALKYFAKWKGNKAPTTIDPPKLNGAADTAVIVDKPGAVQSVVRIGHVGIARNNKDFIKISVMNTLLGGYFSSRININLREVHGYTYGGGSVFDARLAPGGFEVRADVRNEVTTETIEEIYRELRKIRSTLPTKEEMRMVKSYLSGLFPIQLETPQQVAGRVVAIELYGLPKNYYGNYRRNIQRITAADIRAVAKKYIHPEKLTVVVSGNSKEIASSIGRGRAVMIVNSDGKEIGSTHHGEAK